MAARGTQSKEEIQKKIFEIFPNSFMDGKIIRVPMKEDGEDIEIKISLTAAKDLIGGAQSKVEVTPGAAPPDDFMNPPVNNEDWKMTKEEEAQLKDVMSKLGL